MKFGDWTIVEDLSAEEGSKAGTNANAVGTVGPAGCTATSDEIRNAQQAAFFQMFDDDGNHYYSGYCLSCGDERMFSPLDDFGAPNAGCTSIKYRNEKTGEMEVL